ncbi:hypothetical protein [Rossellomorea aquimaris]|uniref:hypothetical protein n=1 Tax=Rossellomorea aquimaris TaxID=189382 RepID=UPI0007D0A9F5|nr:hypothetical protein [Rossellomorea aquimaris]
MFLPKTTYFIPIKETLHWFLAFLFLLSFAFHDIVAFYYVDVLKKQQPTLFLMCWDIVIMGVVAYFMYIVFIKKHTLVFAFLSSYFFFLSFMVFQAYQNL